MVLCQGDEGRALHKDATVRLDGSVSSPMQVLQSSSVWLPSSFGPLGL
jgi:hypothetical protein